MLLPTEQNGIQQPGSEHATPLPEMNTRNPIDFPQTAMVRQQLHRAPIERIEQHLQPAADRLLAGRSVRPGQSVAVAVGSRGISRLDEVVNRTLRLLEHKGLKPTIVPAMGSHGGATAQGQRQVLEKLGISEATMGVPIVAEMETDCIGSLKDGTRIFFARSALAADHLVIINRVKLHTKFRAPVESGLCKMLTIGLGKADGAAEFHRRAVHSGFGIIEEAARVVLESTHVLLGVALLEDGCGQISRIETVGPDGWIETEKRLLQEATAMMGRIPFEHIDVLVGDRQGHQRHRHGLQCDRPPPGPGG